MRLVLQRVKQGSVSVAGRRIAAIDQGLVLLVGIGPVDDERKMKEMAEKVAHLRIFEDGQGKMNRSLLDVGGAVIVVSQFTLYADTRKGRRPSFTGAGAPEMAKPLVEHFGALMAEMGVAVQYGEFGADMLVEIHNDGPVTILMEC